MLKRVRIRDFRSITDLEIDLENLNIFVGRNDTGKSNILRALNLFFNGETDFRRSFNFSQDFSQNSRMRQGKAPEIRIDLTLELPSGYQTFEGARYIEWSKRWRRNETIGDPPMFVLSGNKKEKIGARSKMHSYLENIDYHYIPALKGKEFFSELLSDIYDVLSDVSAEDLKSASEPLQSRVEAILADVANEIQSILKSRSEPKLPANLRSVFRLIQFEANGIDLDRRGDGIRVRHVPSLVKFLCDLKSQRAGRYKSFHVWGLEEPENSVDFIAAFEMRDQILAISKNNQYQVLMATHSPIFFSLESADDVKTNFFSQEGSQTVIAHGGGDISDEMGVLRVVAPYVEKSRAEVDQIKKTLAKLTGKLEGDVVDPSRRIVFVEGDTDVSVFTAVNNLTDILKDTRFVSSIADGGSSANVVSDNAIAWHFLQKNRPPEKRVKGVGLVDGDSAGDSAIERFNLRMEGEDNFQSRIERIRPTKELAQLYKKNGFSPKLALEALFPLDVWRKAKESGWLDKRSNSQLFGMCDKDTREKLLERGMSVLSDSDDDLMPLIYEVKIGKKKEFADLFLERLSGDHSLAEPFKPTLNELRSILNKSLV
ncbi:DUF2813 domain-containing protein [bacterium M00.F.Ca.ET.159.01.1.1]|nr:DUF2813 domain-containing protein [bacterium M00.F.Ca.ET.159.01.1.1]TGT80706.1 DUF2813 domain-containing protein [bacterium M00.F.Ca.ET.157.01.1.1]